MRAGVGKTRSASVVRKVVERELGPLRKGAAKVVLAISGGVDSAVLLHAAASVLPAELLVVANFDHGTGAAAREAQALVARQAGAVGAAFVAGSAPRGTHATLTTEATWRQARWAFLRGVADEAKSPAGAAVICTAHTADDQIETVLMRAMRDAGARGLAALAADSADIRRPMLATTRRDVEAYALSNGIAWVEDPSNQSLRHLRNRVRHQILPALRRAEPRTDAALFSIGESAANWRRELDAWLDAHVAWRTRAAGIDVAVGDLACHATGALPMLWGALAARGGVALDRRGAVRLAEFTERGRVGSRIQLSGGWTVTRSREWIELRGPRAERARVTNRSESEVVLESVALAAGASSAWEPGVGSWRFTQGDAAAGHTADVGDWSAWLAPTASLKVRSWAPGDTVQTRPSGPPRKVKLLLARAGITGELRRFWPVVLEGDHIVWVPGVYRSPECRNPAAADRFGRPALPFICAYVDR